MKYFISISKYPALLSLILMASIGGGSAYALPLNEDGTIRNNASGLNGTFGSSGIPTIIDSDDLLDHDLIQSKKGDVDFRSIIALDNCSGSLVRFSTSLDTDHAIVMTNGHCLKTGFLKPGEVLVDRPVVRTLKLLSPDGKQVLKTLNADLVLYATMTKTDLTLYRVKETYEEIQKGTGLAPLTMSAVRSEPGRDIAVASGFWKNIWSCKLDKFIYQMKEADWVWVDSIRYSKPGCEVVGGSSGSPIIDVLTYEVIGINNTGNEQGQKCTLNNPCEIDENGNVTVNHKTGYGQQTYWIYTCLDVNTSRLNLDKLGCLLPKN